MRRRRTLTDRDLIAARPTDHVPKGQPMTDAPATPADPRRNRDSLARVDAMDTHLPDADPIIHNLIRTRVGRQGLCEAIATTLDADVNGRTLQVAARWLRTLAVGEKRNGNGVYIAPY